MESGSTMRDRRVVAEPHQINFVHKKIAEDGRGRAEEIQYFWQPM